MQNNSTSSELGPWAGADLAGTANQFAGEGADDDIDEVHRFGRNVARLTLRRVRQHMTEMRRDAIAVFLFKPEGVDGALTQRRPMLGDGGIEICGKIWFVSATAQSGRELIPPSEDDGQIFDYIEGLGLGAVPAAVFNPTVTTPIVRLYPSGLANEDAMVSVEISNQEITLDHVRTVIDNVHEKQLCTPDAQVSGVSMWADPSKYWASSSAEAIAQVQVKTALSFALFNCDARHAQRMAAGRVDIELVQRLDNGTTVTPAEIEIKVLRERNRRGQKWSDARNEKWMRRGIRQAAAYRDIRGAQAGMLCCFDMRATDAGDVAAFAPVQAYADAHNVALHRNYLYNDAETWRIARYGI